MGMHELAQLDQSGDIKTVWDSEIPIEVEAAKKQFDDLVAKGFAIFKVDKTGEKGTKMHRFDPDAESMIAVPRVVGG